MIASIATLIHDTYLPLYMREVLGLSNTSVGLPARLGRQCARLHVPAASVPARPALRRWLVPPSPSHPTACEGWSQLAPWQIVSA